MKKLNKTPKYILMGISIFKLTIIFFWISYYIYQYGEILFIFFLSIINSSQIHNSITSTSQANDIAEFSADFLVVLMVLSIICFILSFIFSIILIIKNSKNITRDCHPKSIYILSILLTVSLLLPTIIALSLIKFSNLIYTNFGFEISYNKAIPISIPFLLSFINTILTIIIHNEYKKETLKSKNIASEEILVDNTYANKLTPNKNHNFKDILTYLFLSFFVIIILIVIIFYIK